MVLFYAGNLEHFYIGCYAKVEDSRDDIAEISISGNSMSIGSCIYLCLPLNTTFAALTVISMQMRRVVHSFYNI